MINPDKTTDMEQSTCFLRLLILLILAGVTEAVTDPPVVDDSSCAGSCDATYVPNKPCYCNEACIQYENCCFDFYQLCRPDFIWSDDWQVYEGHKYKYFANISITADQAADACKSVGAMLLSINSPKENTFIQLSVLKKRTVSAFIGGTDKQQEGSWFWSDGTQISLPRDDNAWHVWFEGQPDNSGGEEHCSIITNYQFWDLIKFMINHYVWRDYSCSANIGKQIQGYVCEGTEACDSNPCQNNGTCVYAGAGQEYKCMCTENYLGDHCQFEVIKGESWTRCGETNLQGSSGVVTSPLYPDLYPNNVMCQWIIQVEQQYTVHLQFEDFMIEEGKDCAFDSLVIFDGDSVNHTVLFKTSCGHMEQLKQATILSSGNQVRVEMRTDHSVRKKGFKLAYKTEKCGEGVGQSGCGTRQTFTSQCGDIDLQYGPPETVDPCQWLIDVPDGNIVNLTFADFNILYSDKDCKSGHVRVFDGPNEDYPLVGQYCGYRFPWTVFSTGSQIYIELTGSVYTSRSAVKIKYQAIDSSTFQHYHDDVHIIDDQSGDFITSEYSINMEMDNKKYKKWMIQVRPGDKVTLMYEAEMTNSSTLQIYDGSTEKFPILIDIDDPYSLDAVMNVVNVSMFQAFIVLSYEDEEPKIKISYEAQEWTPDLSGCYRPMYYYAPYEKAYENNLVSPREPVVIMASDMTHGGKNIYEPGMYCKWRISSSGPWSLSMDVLDLTVYPVTDDCQYDGVIVYQKRTDGTTDKQGPFCGSGLSVPVITSNSAEMEVVFYSANRGNSRIGGIFRAVVTAVDTTNPYELHEVATESKTLISSYGTLLSPGFPFLVDPGVYFWVVDSGDVSTYFNIYLYYVRGPALQDGCKQTFKILEVSRAKGTIRHDETAMLKLCSDTDVFIPKKRLKVPPKQKFAIELDTAGSSLSQSWQFKLSYSVDTLEQSPYTQSDTEFCEGADYHYFRGSCYMYIPWVYRHYYPEYSFQQTWQGSKAYCEGQNATLVNIHDLETATYIKNMLGTGWYWTEAQYQSNARMIFIGLSNKKSNYEWMDKVQLSFADWYTPGQDWEQSLFHVDTIKTDFINADNIQPAADAGMLCVAMLPLNPFGSMNWVKIPCDYPMFRSGLICEKPALVKSNDPNTTIVQKTNFVKPKEQMAEMYEKSFIVCPSGYVLFGGRCLQLYTNYTLVSAYFELNYGQQFSDNEAVQISKLEAEEVCSNIGGTITSVSRGEFLHFTKYLDIWRHDVYDGNIWMAGSQSCQYIHVFKEDHLSEVIKYSIAEQDCDNIINVRSVLCEAQTIAFSEACSSQEFSCDNGMCVSIDSRCDNHNDCMDNSDEHGCACGEDMFSCSNGQCIPLSLYCDFVDHCGDNSDEQHCVSERCSTAEFQCKSGQCIQSNQMCDFITQCADHSDEAPALCESQCKGIQCFSGSCISPQLEKDLIPDCPGFALEDELDTNTELQTFFDIFKNNIDSKNYTYLPACESDGSLAQCRDGHQHCYRREKLCIFDTTVVNEASRTIIQDTCRDGSHLRTYCDSVEQPGMFQCTAGYTSYYIPLRKMCDGLKDCPHGEDEYDCDNFICPGLLRCKDSSYCISHTEVCDGHVHCPVHREDEKYCGVQDALCTQGCSCYGHVINCEHHNITVMPDTSNMTADPITRALILRGNHLQVTETSFRRYHFLGRLILSHNDITELPVRVFKGLKNLFELDLSYNKLRTFQDGVFEGLLSLHKLDLSNNMLSELSMEALAGLSTVRHLIMTQNSLNIVPDNTFDDLQALDIINTDAYKFCCIAKHVPECTPQADEFSSCEDLMASYTLQICIWVLAMMALLGNIFVIVWRIKKEKTKVSSFFIINLGVSDMLMGLYLLIIASVDVHYRGKYIMYADDWKTSALCQLAGVLSTISSEVSVFMLTAMTTERFLSIVFPLKVGQIRMRYARIIAMVGWIVCFFLSVLPALGLPYFGNAFFGRTGVCLPFHLSDERLPGWEYSVFVFLVINFISFIAILIGYVGIFMKVKSANKEMCDNSTGGTDEYKLAKKLVLIVATDFLCWVPIILIGFAALGGVAIPPQVSAWVAVFILPLNSSLNPILYTISALEFNRKRKKSHSKSYKSTTITKAVSSSTMGN